jgi:F-type H+-transporting ATPase subunit gamma
MKTRQIKNRIKGVKKTQQITRTMEMVAAARIKKAQARIEAARPYALKMVELMESVTASAGAVEHPLLDVREPQTVMAVLFTANRGLCGSFNSNVIRRAEALIERETSLGRKVKLVVLGKKGVTYFRFKGVSELEVFDITDRAEFAEAKAVADHVVDAFTNGEVDAVYLIFNHFKSLLRQIPTEFKLLPFEGSRSEEEGPQTPVDYLWEPSAEDVLYSLLPTYMDTLVYRALLESAASEHAARRAAMKNATDNASEMIRTLTLRLNKARQAQITQELTEIVTSAEAIKYSEGK